MNRLLFAVMYPNHELLDKTLTILTKEFGPIFSKSNEYEFNFTNYYEPEFGKNLKKIILVFEKVIKKDDLIAIRERTGEIELELAKGNNRSVNIDPGYISAKELVLATKKGKNFKELLGNGVYAHKVLEFSNGEIIMFKHTFADYRSEKNIEFFKKIIA